MIRAIKYIFVCFIFLFVVISNLGFYILGLMPSAKQLCVDTVCQQLPESWYVYVNNRNDDYLLYGFIPEFAYPHKSFIHNNKIMSFSHFKYTIINKKRRTALYIYAYDTPYLTPDAVISGVCKYGVLYKNENNKGFVMHNSTKDLFLYIYPVGKEGKDKLPLDIEFFLCESLREKKIS